MPLPQQAVPGLVVAQISAPQQLQPPQPPPQAWQPSAQGSGVQGIASVSGVPTQADPAAEVQNLRALLRAKEQAALHDRQKLTQLQAQVHSVRDEVEAQYKGQLDRLSADLTFKDNEVQEACRSRARLQAELDDLRSQAVASTRMNHAAGVGSAAAAALPAMRARDGTAGIPNTPLGAPTTSGSSPLFHARPMRPSPAGAAAASAARKRRAPDANLSSLLPPQQVSAHGHTPNAERPVPNGLGAPMTAMAPPPAPPVPLETAPLQWPPLRAATAAPTPSDSTPRQAALAVAPSPPPHQPGPMHAQVQTSPMVQEAATSPPSAPLPSEVPPPTSRAPVVTAAAAPPPLLVRLLAPTTSSLRHLLLTPPGDPSPPSSRALSSQLLGAMPHLLSDAEGAPLLVLCALRPHLALPALPMARSAISHATAGTSASPTKAATVRGPPAAQPSGAAGEPAASQPPAGLAAWRLLRDLVRESRPCRALAATGASQGVMASGGDGADGGSGKQANEDARAAAWIVPHLVELVRRLSADTRGGAPFLEAALETLVTIAWGEPTADLSQLHAWIVPVPGERRAVFAQLLAAQVPQSVRLGAFELLSLVLRNEAAFALFATPDPDDNATQADCGASTAQAVAFALSARGLAASQGGGARLNSGRDVPAAPWRPPHSRRAARGLPEGVGEWPLSTPTCAALKLLTGLVAQHAGAAERLLTPRLDLKLTERLVWTLQAHVHSLLRTAGGSPPAAELETVRGSVLLLLELARAPSGIGRELQYGGWSADLTSATLQLVRGEVHSELADLSAPAKLLQNTIVAVA